MAIPERSLVSNKHILNLSNPILEISAIRTINNAQQQAAERSSEIGFSDLHKGVIDELGPYVVNGVLNSYRVYPFRFERVLDTLRHFRDGTTLTTQTQGEAELSTYANDVVKHAIRRAGSRKSPTAQRVNARDLLDGIALVAIESDVFED